jgi:hypothetical protein
MIIFGGQSGGASLDDAWAFDLAADTWTQLASAPETGGRKFPAAAYDPVNDELLVFGGESTDGTRGGDLWALSLESDTWQQRTDEGPSARDGAVLVHVPGEDRFVLFGGTGEDGNLGDTWIYALPPRPTAVVSSSTVTPAAPGLEAWPNPFNAGVVLDVAGSQPSQLRIYDSLGRQVRDLGAVPAGGRRLSWDGTDAQGREAASGLYLVVARYAGATQAKRVVLVR